MGSNRVLIQGLYVYNRDDSSPRTLISQGFTEIYKFKKICIRKGLLI